jgi:hypothetical protein
VKAQKFGGLDPAMPGDNLILIVDQHWVVEAKSGYAIGNLSDLLLRMSSRVSFVRPQFAEQCILNVH